MAAAVSPPPLASTPGMVTDAIFRFSDEVGQSPALAGRLAYARAWYAAKRADGTWRFGPSKFCGYEGLDADSYVDLSRKCLDGRVCELQLQRWFHEVDSGSELYAVLISELSAFLAQYGKAPSRKMRINVRNDVHDDQGLVGADGEKTALVDLIVAVARLLSASELDALQKRLKALSRDDRP